MFKIKNYSLQSKISVLVQNHALRNNKKRERRSSCDRSSVKQKQSVVPVSTALRHDPVNAGVAVATPTCYATCGCLPADEASLPAHGAPCWRAHQQTTESRPGTMHGLLKGTENFGWGESKTRNREENNMAKPFLQLK